MSKIPKRPLTSNYYKKLYEDSLTRLDENHMRYLSSLYKRSWQLSLVGKTADAEELLRSGRRIVKKKEEERLRIEEAENLEKERVKESRKIALQQRRRIMSRLTGKPVVRKRDNKKYNLRSNRVRRRVFEEFPENLNEFISLYVEQIKHKKESLIAFLKKMFEAKYVYNELTKKWGRFRE